MKSTAFWGTGRIVFLTRLAHWPPDWRICISCLDYTWTPGRTFAGMENGNWSFSWEDLLVNGWWSWSKPQGSRYALKLGGSSPSPALVFT